MRFSPLTIQYIHDNVLSLARVADERYTMESMARTAKQGGINRVSYIFQWWYTLPQQTKDEACRISRLLCTGGYYDFNDEHLENMLNRAIISPTEWAAL